MATGRLTLILSRGRSVRIGAQGLTMSISGGRIARPSECFCWQRTGERLWLQHAHDARTVGYANVIDCQRRDHMRAIVSQVNRLANGNRASREFVPLLERLSEPRRKQLRARMQELRKSFQARHREETLSKKKISIPYDEVYEAGVDWLNDLAGGPFPDQPVSVAIADSVWKSESRRGNDRQLAEEKNNE